MLDFFALDVSFKLELKDINRNKKKNPQNHIAIVIPVCTVGS